MNTNCSGRVTACITILHELQCSEHAREIDIVMMKFDIGQLCCLNVHQSIVYGEPIPRVQILLCCHNTLTRGCSGVRNTPWICLLVVIYQEGYEA